MIYPQKLSSKKGEKVLKIFLYVSIVLGIVLVIINKLTTPGIHWAALANCGIIYTWITTLYSIKRIGKPLKTVVFRGFCLLPSKAISTVPSYADELVLNRFTFLFPRLPACR